MENIEKNNYQEAMNKVAGMSDDDLKMVWKNLDHNKNEDYEVGVTMDQWANLISSEMDKRELPKQVI